MLIAQVTAEYVGAVGVSALLASVERAGYRLSANVQEHPVIWIGAGVLVLWIFFRRPR